MENLYSASSDFTTCDDKKLHFQSALVLLIETVAIFYLFFVTMKGENENSAERMQIYY